MPKIVVSKEEWKIAHAKLDSLPDGAKLPYSAIMSPDNTLRMRRYKDPNAINGYQTTHSFIKLNGTIYAVGQGKSKDSVAGTGQFGKVKYMIDEENAYHVVKIQHRLTDIQKKPLTQDKIKYYDGLRDKEIHNMESLGLSRGSYYNTQKDKYYTHMMYKGNENLDNVIPTLKSDAEQFKIGIDACLKFDRLHRGFDDKNHIGHAHLDIKPGNISIDEEGNCHPIDFGFSEENPNQTLPLIKQTPFYFPHYSHIKDHALWQYDILALKRTLYAPRSVWCSVGRVNSVPDDIRGVFKKELLDRYQLTPYLDTSNGDTYFRKDDQTKASTLAAILINAYLKLNFDPAILYKDQVLSLAIATLYANGVNTAQEIKDALKSEGQKYLIAILGEKDEYKKLAEYQKDLGFMEQLDKLKSQQEVKDLLSTKENKPIHNTVVIQPTPKPLPPKTLPIATPQPKIDEKAKFRLKAQNWGIGSDDINFIIRTNTASFISLATTADLAQHYLEFAKLIEQLKDQQEKFKTDKLTDAETEMQELIDKLTTAAETLVYSRKDNVDFQKFNNACQKAIEEHRPMLETHQDAIRILDTFLTVLASLVVFYPIVWTVQKIRGDNYSFFKTDACKLLDKVDNTLRLIPGVA